MTQQVPPSAGWYRDPKEEAHLRYFDGAAWTGDTRPGPHREREPTKFDRAAAAVLRVLAGASVGGALGLLVTGGRLDETPLAALFAALVAVGACLPVYLFHSQREIRVSDVFYALSFLWIFNLKKAPSCPKPATPEQADKNGQADEVRDPRLRIARAAVRGIVASEAARSGWLGDLEASDFRTDLMNLEEDLRSANQLRYLVKEISSLPNPTAADNAILEEARQKLADLDRRSADRLNLLEKSWARTELLDKTLQKQRENLASDRKREDLHQRMVAALSEIDASPDVTSSSVAEKIVSLTSAYEEINGPIQDGELECGNQPRTAHPQGDA